MEAMEDYTKEPVTLYRMEYLDEGTRIVDWLWLTDFELEDYLEEKAQVAGLIYRAATSEEEELYDEAYRDGYEVAAITVVNDTYDGVTFRVDSITEEAIETTKVFQCAVCDKHDDFESGVATAAGMYLGVLKDDKLWHLCYDCAQGNAEVDWISHGWVWDK